MPTIYSRGKFRFVIRLREPAYKRPHVHILGGDIEVSIALDDFEVLGVSGKVSLKLIQEFINVIEQYHDYFMAAWSEYHG